ncbi:hypothetical protein [Streptomyces sp. NBC_01445]|uniref:hypothetical protein n=1 Tax=Streptomyces sp. NBC_01445 TaxID=2903869 RepID=UPI002DD96D23|nr:hypothetical protein [Streptomyces sp. NBC_01445]WSE02004.1 hypothetical protein OG574_00295 [Streptomyces sp. NBC_01445]WSE10326.1 hypothetical protein OG574_47715 [Streptomyces sp. NBC_01445]WSE11106.1 hypothetical protein OG574_48305 [Streptomyces sp. NBC_01445]
MNTPELTPGPDKAVHVVRDECWELMNRPPEFTTAQAVFPGLLARGRSLPMRLHLALLQSGRVLGQSAPQREEGE